jgi:hypothetical protein
LKPASAAGRLDEMAQTCQNIDAAQAIAAAVAQIELAVRDVQPAVEQLGTLIDHMAAGLGGLRTARPRDADPDAISVFPDEFDRAVAGLQADVHGSITQLQFYDRLVQHLTHVQDFLAGVAGQLASTADGADDAWGVLRDKLRARLISEAQRELLDAVLPPPGGAQFNSRQAREEHAAQGTIELF